MYLFLPKQLSDIARIISSSASLEHQEIIVLNYSSYKEDVWHTNVEFFTSMIFDCTN